MTSLVPDLYLIESGIILTSFDCHPGNDLLKHEITARSNTLPA